MWENVENKSTHAFPPPPHRQAATWQPSLINFLLLAIVVWTKQPLELRWWKYGGACQYRSYLAITCFDVLLIEKCVHCEFRWSHMRAYWGGAVLERSDRRSDRAISGGGPPCAPECDIKLIRSCATNNIIFTFPRQPPVHLIITCTCLPFALLFYFTYFIGLSIFKLYWK